MQIGGVGLWEIDLAANTLRVSPGCNELLGYRPDEIIGKPLSLLYPPGQDDLVPEKLFDAAASSPSSAKERTRRKRSDGSLVDVELTRFVLTDPKGRPVGVCEVSRDITDSVARDLVRRAYAPLYHYVEQEIVQAAVLDGQFRLVDTGVATALILAVYLGGCSPNEESAPLRANARTLAGLVLEGLRGDQSR